MNTMAADDLEKPEARVSVAELESSSNRTRNFETYE